ncbi:DUF2147 domain-containing protein [uncultured Dokdonia sp.]|uniref:DUF2147 domain-containing protein n=1 Tax=uncultured Dokdonia sp. TaxID=575653 RepID=UPI0030EB6D37
MKKHITLLMLLFFAVSIQAQQGTIFGQWKTIDDETGKAMSIIEIYKKDGKVFGKIVDILNPANRDKTCIYCKGEDYDKPLIGLDIIKNLEKDDDEYEGGTIFDPEKGKEYKAKLWIDEDDKNILNVRGYIAFLFRTQQWIRS